MKRKHLFLLFFLTLLIGLLIRQAPWKWRDSPEKPLLPDEYLSVEHIGIQRTGLPELQLVKTDMAWVAEEQERSPMSLDSTGGSADMKNILSTLRQIKALKVLRTHWPDTLGLGQSAIQVSLKTNSGRSEHFKLGYEMTLPDGRKGTWFMLKNQQAVYLVEGHLRQVFDPVLRPKLRPLLKKSDAN
ncbi:MAG: hypothetical protein IT269_02225 [Saprospiraceae bacterium]|nr:hypothetical protein [Saprospiraceae bacterium]